MQAHGIFMQLQIISVSSPACSSLTPHSTDFDYIDLILSKSD